MRQQTIGWSLLVVLGCSVANPVLGYPSMVTSAQVERAEDTAEWKPYAPAVAPEGRKFAEKPNSTKKVVTLEDRNDIDDVQTNQISVGHFCVSHNLYV